MKYAVTIRWHNLSANSWTSWKETYFPTRACHVDNHTQPGSQTKIESYRFLYLRFNSRGDLFQLVDELTSQSSMTHLYKLDENEMKNKYLQ